MKWSCVILFVIVNVFGVLAQDDYCFSNDDDKKQTKHYATKTPYEVARGTDKNGLTVYNCEPIKFWMLSRHGTRNPSVKSIEKLRGLIELRNAVLDNYKRHDRDRHLSQLCADDLEYFKNWQFDRNLTSQFAEYLTVQGWNDIKYMAIDYQRAFQNLIETRYSQEKFKFGFTDTQRTEASYKAFIEGLFGPNAEGIIDTRPEANNSILLRPYESCAEFQKQEDRAKDNSSEFYKFQQTNVFKKTAEEVSIRLGFKYTLNPQQIDTIFDMCRYDQAWFLQENSAWCAAFTPEHVNVLEYLEDLKYFYKSGPGSELNSNIMCAAVKDMLATMKRDDGPKVTAYFSHSSAVQLMLTALGYVNDNEPLRADNYNQMKYRKFRTSVLTPLGTNLAVIKYDCPNDPNERYKFQFVLNERVIEFNWCKIGLCDYSKLMETYRRFINADCAKTYCGGSSGVTVKVSILLLFAATISSYFF